MSIYVEVVIETWGGSPEDAELVVRVDGVGFGFLSLRELKAALDAIPES